MLSALLEDPFSDAAAIPYDGPHSATHSPAPSLDLSHTTSRTSQSVSPIGALGHGHDSDSTLPSLESGYAASWEQFGTALSSASTDSGAAPLFAVPEETESVDVGPDTSFSLNYAEILRDPFSTSCSDEDTSALDRNAGSNTPLLEFVEEYIPPPATTSSVPTEGRAVLNLLQIDEDLDKLRPYYRVCTALGPEFYEHQSVYPGSLRSTMPPITDRLSYSTVPFASLTPGQIQSLLVGKDPLPRTSSIGSLNSFQTADGNTLHVDMFREHRFARKMLDVESSPRVFDRGIKMHPPILDFAKPRDADSIEDEKAEDFVGSPQLVNMMPPPPRSLWHEIHRRSLERFMLFPGLTSSTAVASAAAAATVAVRVDQDMLNPLARTYDNAEYRWYHRLAPVRLFQRGANLRPARRRCQFTILRDGEEQMVTHPLIRPPSEDYLAVLDSSRRDFFLPEEQQELERMGHYMHEVSEQCCYCLEQLALLRDYEVASERRAQDLTTLDCVLQPDAEFAGSVPATNLSSCVSSSAESGSSSLSYLTMGPSSHFMLRTAGATQSLSPVSVSVSTSTPPTSTSSPTDLSAVLTLQDIESRFTQTLIARQAERVRREASNAWKDYRNNRCPTPDQYEMSPATADWPCDKIQAHWENAQVPSRRRVQRTRIWARFRTRKWFSGFDTQYWARKWRFYTEPFHLKYYYFRRQG
ncbi:uncharacterized protein V1518DRAFT_6627 [Limtongia smithiae]|uniref:uncharacterized protein n=1 Tax=Limtongia smithiae TaxID=1125753 RepID=UPI0034CEB37C